MSMPVSDKHPSSILSSEKRFELLVTSISDYAIYLLDPSGHIVSWNAGAQRFKGYSQDEIIGKHFSLFFTPSDLENKLPWNILEQAATLGRFEAEGWRVRKDGSRFRAHVIIDAIHNDEGRLIGFAKITRDITDKYHAEETLAKANAALLQSQKMDAIGKLTGGVAHDFNNLLSVISTGLEVFALGALDSRQVKMVDSMKRAIDRGATLTQQLLSFARQQPLTAKTQNINKLIGSFEPLLLKVGNSTIKFKFNLAPNITPAKIDATGFETALLNLIVNSRDAMPEGGTITVITEEIKLTDHEVGSLGEGSYIKVSVQDTGEGIDPDAMSHILEPFFTTKDVGKGTGLGLSQVYGFMIQSGGDIAINSRVGEGTTVSLYFPASEDLDEIVEINEQEEIKVLIVDDEEDLLLAATELFRSMGYTVFTAHSAEDALDRLWHSTGISVLFADILMPGGMNGIQLAREVRQMNPDIKIILASGYPLPALKEEHGNMDEFSFINKPYRLADIARCLRTPDVTHEVAHP